MDSSRNRSCPPGKHEFLFSVRPAHHATASGSTTDVITASHTAMKCSLSLSSQKGLFFSGVLDVGKLGMD
eukprot:4903664-Ditylum_brightwellii.AAC.1